MAPFDASPCLVKTQRARHHAAQFLAIAKDIESAGNQLITETERDGRSVTVTARLVSPLPSALSCIAGDVVHNLRCALDHLVCLEVQMNGGEIDRQQFPVCRNR